MTTGSGYYCEEEHETLKRLATGLYRCPACGAVVIIPRQDARGVYNALQVAAQMDADEGKK